MILRRLYSHTDPLEPDAWNPTLEVNLALPTRRYGWCVGFGLEFSPSGQERSLRIMVGLVGLDVWWQKP